MFVPRANISDLWAGVAIAAAALMFAAILAPVIWAAVRGEYRRHKARKGSVVEWGLMALMGVGIVLYGGAKGGGSVSYPRTNANYELLKDAGSSVSNDYVTIAYTRHQLVPDDADLQVWRRPLELTNDTDWVEHLVTTVGAFPSPQTIEFANAISNNWAVFTTWSPAPAVQTNGVLHVLWRGTNSAPHRLDAIPIGSEVREGGFTIAPPRKPIKFDYDNAMQIEIQTIAGFPFVLDVVSCATPSYIDWGDGTISTCKNGRNEHIYNISTNLIVSLDNSVYQFVVHQNNMMYIEHPISGDTYVEPYEYSVRERVRRIIQWGAFIIYADSAFEGCSGLTGDIPPWGGHVISAVKTFKGCTGLTGAWTDDPNALMPNTIQFHADCFIDASPAIRALFYPAWGGTKPVPTK